MSLFQKLFKHKQKNDAEQKTREKSDTSSHDSLSVCSSNNTTDDCSFDEGEEGLNKRNEKLKQLRTTLRKYNKQEEQRVRAQREVMQLGAEVAQLMTLIAVSKSQSNALEADILNKKCEMKFLRSEAPEGMEMEVKKREPLYNKKYHNAKTAADAKNLLTAIRQRQRALQYLEFMTYNKYLDLQHHLKLDAVKKRAHLLNKDKPRNFNHLIDAINAREKASNPSSAETSPLARSQQANSAPSTPSVESPSRDITTVVVAPQTVSSPSSEANSPLQMTSTPPMMQHSGTIQFPNVFRPPFDMSSHLETMI